MYPDIEPYHKDFLQVSPIHKLYYEECGNPQGLPVIYLHGGPGAGSTPPFRRFFDPSFYHIILFDQRGAGQSQPYASLEENPPWDLVADLERLRAHLNLPRWLVFGGSWGSTLALVYAINHPEVVTGLILRGIYLGRHWENQWLFQEGASYFFPDPWRHYVDLIPAAERGDLIGAYYQRLTADDLATRLEASRRWAGWEDSVARLIPAPSKDPATTRPDEQLAIARTECHYFVNELFYPSDNYILEHAAAIRHIPTRIVHGRYDLICPIRSAFELVEQLPQADFRIIPDAGHTSMEPGIAAALVQATDDFRKLLSHEDML
jgi:proline iminopeptidase